jgi:hypothetical protein
MDSRTKVCHDKLIYNPLDNILKLPKISLNDERVMHQCVRIKDPVTHHWTVVIACGYHDSTDDNSSDDARFVEVWDLVTNQVNIIDTTTDTGSIGSFTCPNEDYFEFADELTDYQVHVINR